MKLPKTRNYRYKGADTSKEQRTFWIMVVIGIAIMAAIIFLF